VIGKGGFGTVVMAKDRLEDVFYAIKKVRLHLPSTGDFGENVRNHRVFREVTALSKSSYQEMKHVVRYYNSWLEDLTPQERRHEQLKMQKYKERAKRLSSVEEDESGSKWSHKYDSDDEEGLDDYD
jgi:serine/threonine protein kinase